MSEIMEIPEVPPRTQELCIGAFVVIVLIAMIIGMSSCDAREQQHALDKLKIERNCPANLDEKKTKQSAE